MPKATLVGAKLDSSLTGQQKARKALDAAVELQQIAQKRTDDAMAEMNAANDGLESVRKKAGPRQYRWWRNSRVKSAAGEAT